MKVAFLAQRDSIHTVRWVNALAQGGYEVHLISSRKEVDALHPKVSFHKLPQPPPLGYFLNVAALKRLLEELKPDLLHTHFASGYGTLGRLSGFHPNILSVWGSDVFDFPAKSPLHRWLVVQNLCAADWVCSTSQVMAEQTRRLYPVDKLSVTPFGIDTAKFAPQPKERDTSTITVGTVKTLAPKYGVDLLIRTFAATRKHLQNTKPELAIRLRLLIVGGGPQQAELVDLVKSLNLDAVTHFSGRVSHDDVPRVLNQLDIYVALSRLESESFGVAVLEASACGLPVVVADVGGLPEVVRKGVTGLVVQKESVDAAAQALTQLVLEPSLRRRMGLAGREHVLTYYDWTHNVSLLEDVYERVLNHGDSL